MQRWRAARHGTQLVEVMVAVTLLGIVLTGVLGVLPTAWAGMRQAQSRLEVDALASSLLEARRDLPWEELLVGNREQLEPVVAGSATLHPVVEVLAVQQTSPDDVKELKVTITWEHGSVTRQASQSLVLVNLRP